jgi:hypothetical protein
MVLFLSAHGAVSLGVLGPGIPHRGSWVRASVLVALAFFGGLNVDSAKLESKFTLLF